MNKNYQDCVNLEQIIGKQKMLSDLQTRLRIWDGENDCKLLGDIQTWASNEYEKLNTEFDTIMQDMHLRHIEEYK